MPTACHGVSSAQGPFHRSGWKGCCLKMPRKPALGPYSPRRPQAGPSAGAVGGGCPHLGSLSGARSRHRLASGKVKGGRACFQSHEELGPRRRAAQAVSWQGGCA